MSAPNHQAAFEAITSLGLDKVYDDLLCTLNNIDHVTKTHVVSQISAEQSQQFNKLYFTKDRLVFDEIRIHLPVICVNGPIHEVLWNPSAGIEGTNEIPHCITSIRKQGWPGAISKGLLNVKPTIPAIVTNTQNLALVLNDALLFSNTVAEHLVQIPDTVIERWPLESELHRIGLKRAEAISKAQGYRVETEMDIADEQGG